MYDRRIQIILKANEMVRTKISELNTLAVSTT